MHAIEAVGEVRAIAAPNRFHHLFLSQWREAYPHALLYVPSSLVRKRADLADADVHTDEAPAAYAAEMSLASLPLLASTIAFSEPHATNAASKKNPGTPSECR